jgi:hypothetical protein
VNKNEKDMSLYDYKLENRYLRSEVEKLKEKNVNLKKMIKENQNFENSILSTKHSEYEALYKEKCEDFEFIENKFESISNKFNLILENMTNYQNSLLADNMRLKDAVLFLIKSFNEKEFDNINYLIKYIQENDTFLCTNEEKPYSSIVGQDAPKHKKEVEEESFDDSFQCEINNTGNNKLSKNPNEFDFDKNNKFVEINFSDLKMKNVTNPPSTIPSAKRNNSACKIINHDKFKVNNYSDLQNRNSNMNTNNKSSLSSLNSPEKSNIYYNYQLSSLDRLHVKEEEQDKQSYNEASFTKYSDKKRYSSKQNDKRDKIPRDTNIIGKQKEII